MNPQLKQLIKNKLKTELLQLIKNHARTDAEQKEVYIMLTEILLKDGLY